MVSSETLSELSLLLVHFLTSGLRKLCNWQLASCHSFSLRKHRSKLYRLCWAAEVRFPWACVALKRE
jgi:hypothetical protein